MVKKARFNRNLYFLCHAKQRCVNRLYALLIFCLISQASYGQTFKAMFLNPNVYRTRVDLRVIRITNLKLDTVYNDTFQIRLAGRGYMDYKIIKEDEFDNTIIRILPKARLQVERVHDTSNIFIDAIRYTNDVVLKSDSDNAYNYYFAIRKEDYKPLAKTLLASKIVGVPLIVPTKIRPQRKKEGWNLDGQIFVTYNFGLRKKLGRNPFTDNFITFIPYGIGVGAAQYFRENSTGKFVAQENTFAITYYQAGCLFTINRINMGALIGLDAMIDRQNDWYYQSQPWLSVGFGYKLSND